MKFVLCREEKTSIHSQYLKHCTVIYTNSLYNSPISLYYYHVCFFSTHDGLNFVGRDISPELLLLCSCGRLRRLSERFTLEVDGEAVVDSIRGFLVLRLRAIHVDYTGVHSKSVSFQKMLVFFFSVIFLSLFLFTLCVVCVPLLLLSFAYYCVI